ncbi:MAG: hypothetical protein IKK75_12285 [Clostridia bacterium]|nr:hypothetical protein [Clostridia bacterium]
MFRKWLTILVALMMMAMPFGAMADTQHTLSIVPGDVMASEQAVVDLLNVLDLRLTTGEKSSALTVLLNDQEIVSLGLTADASGLFADSQVLGEDVLYITWDDAFALLSTLMQVGLAESGVNDPEMIQAMETAMDEMKNSLIAAFEMEVVANPQVSVTLTPEESIAAMTEAFPDDPEMAAFAEALYNDMVMEEGTFADENRDTADQKIRMTMDKEDLLNVYDTQFMRDSLRESLTAQYPDLTEEDLELVIAEAKKMLEAGEFEMIMEVYTADEGATLVGMDMDMNMVMQDNGTSTMVAMEMDGGYDRLTGADGVSHKADVTVQGDGIEVKFAFELNNLNSGVSNGLLGMLVEGEEFVVTYNGESSDADTRVRKFDLYVRSGATAILQPAASDRPIIGFVVTTEPADEALLSDLENATAENSVNVMSLSEAELNALGETISTNFMQVYFTALSQLPTSVLNMLMAE